MANINHRKSKYEYCIKCVGNPKDEMPFYLNVIQPLFYNVFRLRIFPKYLDSGTTYGFVAYSKDLALFLTQNIGLPLGKKNDVLCVPSIFINNESLSINFIRGLFDTDGSISFKKRYRDYPYYPVISFSSKSETLVRQTSVILKRLGFKLYELYNYKTFDGRMKKGYTTICRIELNGVQNLSKWLKLIGFNNPKHIEKIKKNGMKNSEGKI